MPDDVPDNARARLVVTLFCVFAAAVAFHGVLLPMVETGGDAVEGWFFVKKLSWGIEITDREWNHRTVRFGILGPAYAAATVFGTRPWVYYVAPLLMSGIAAVLLFRLVDRRFGRSSAWLITGAFCLFPQIHDVAAQQKPEIFSLVYVLGCANALAAFGDTEKRAHLVVAGVWLFFAYWTKLPNLFFVPGLVALLLAEGGRAKEAALFGGTALLLIGAENIVHVSAGQEYGRVGYTVAKHFTSKALESTDLIGLFGRYTQLTGTWALLFAAYGVAAVVTIARRKTLTRFEQALVVLPLVFFVCTTFAIKSVDPLVPAQPFRDRYLSAAVTQVFAAVVLILWLALTDWPGSTFLWVAIPCVAAFCVALYALFPALRSGKIMTVALPATSLFGSLVRATPASTAASYCIGPSTFSSGRHSFTIRVASRTLSTSLPWPDSAVE